MSLQQLFTSRKPYNASTYVAGKGKLFYNELTGQLRLGDGHTPGGQPIAVTTNIVTTESIVPDQDNIYGIGTNLLRWNHLHLGDGGIYFDGVTTPQTEPFLPTALPHPMLPATDNITDLGDPDHRFRNLYLGPASLFMADTITDANIELKVTNGTLYINGAQNLAVGNLVILNTTLKTLTPDLNINIGDATDTGLATIGRQTVITTPNLGSQTAALLINGATTLPVDPSPLTFDGTMIHTVAQVGQSARIVQDAYGQNNYPIYVGRMARGTIDSPTASSTGDILLRLSGNGYGSNGFGSGGTARIDFTAVEPYTDVAKGSRIDFWTTPAGTTSITNNASVTSEGFKGNGFTFTADDTRQTTAGIPLTQKKIANAPYVATLDSTGKLDPTQIPSSLTGAIVFKGVWNANTNTPTLSNTLPAGLDTGWEYIVEVGGTRDIGDGSKTFLAGDFVIFDGTHWKQVPSGNAFVSLSSGGHITVNQTTGVMTLGSDATPNSTVSTIVSRDSSGNFAANVITASLSGNVTGNVTGNVSGNAGTVTNGVYTSGSYANPSWITSLDYSKLSGSVPTAYSSVYIGTTSVAFNRASGALSLAGVSIDGNAGTVTNGVYTSGSYSDPSWLTISKSKVGLSNVDNTADANKNVLYAATAGGAPATDVYAWAKAATKPTYTKSEVGLSAVENTALSTWAGSTNITTVGTLGSLSVTATITGSVSGNAGTVTNGVYTTGNQSIDGTKTFTSTIQGTITTATLANSVAGGIGVGTLAAGTGTAVSTSTGAVTVWFNTSTLVANAVSAITAGTVTTAAQPAITSVGTLTNLVVSNTATLGNMTLTGNSIYSSNTTTDITIGQTSASANIVMNRKTVFAKDISMSSSTTITTPRIVINDGGIRTVNGGTALTIDFSVDSIILWTAPSGTAAITLQNYTAGAQVKVIIAMTTSRNVTYGISTAANSSDGNDNFKGAGAGSVSIANTAMHLEYTCISAVAGGCYVKVTVL